MKKTKSDTSLKSNSNSLLSQLINKSRNLDRVRIMISIEDQYKKRIEKRLAKMFEEKYQLYNRCVEKYIKSDKLYYIILLYDENEEYILLLLKIGL